MTTSPADTPFFPEGSLIREVQRERLVALSGARALFMQAAHPVAFIGFFGHTQHGEDPHPRLARTALAMNTVIYGSERQALEVNAIVSQMHARVRGTLSEAIGPYPAGTEFRGDDPELLMWILGAFVDSSYLAFERYVRPLSAGEREELWQQWRKVGAVFGLLPTDMPSTYGVFREYIDAMVESGLLIVTDEARDVARRVILNPPIPAALAPVKELVNQLTIESLPSDLRAQFGFAPVPGRGLALGALGEWWRLIARPLAPEVVRYVPDFVMPTPQRGYSEIATIVAQRTG